MKVVGLGMMDWSWDLVDGICVVATAQPRPQGCGEGVTEMTDLRVPQESLRP